MRTFLRMGLCCLLMSWGLMAQRGGGGHGGGGMGGHGGGGMGGGGMRGGGGFHGGGGGGFHGGGGGFRGGTGFRGGFGRGFNGFGRGFNGRGFIGGFWPGFGWGWGGDYSPYWGYWDDPYAYGGGYGDPGYTSTYGAGYDYNPSPNVTVIYPANPQTAPVYTTPAVPVIRNYDQYGQEVPPGVSTAPLAPPSSSGSPIYLIATKDQAIRAAASYWVVGRTLHYVTLQHEEKTIPLDSLDRSLTMDLNRERRVPFQLPQ